MNSENIGDILYIVIVAFISIIAAVKTQKDKRQKKETKPIFKTPEFLEEDIDFEEYGDKKFNKQLKEFVEEQKHSPHIPPTIPSPFKNAEGVSAIQEHLKELKAKGYTKQQDIYNLENIQNKEQDTLFATPNETMRAIIYHEIMNPKFKQL